MRICYLQQYRSRKQNKNMWWLNHILVWENENDQKIGRIRMKFARKTTLYKMQVVVYRCLLYLFIVYFLCVSTGYAMVYREQCLIGSDCLNFQFNEGKIISVAYIKQISSLTFILCVCNT